MLNTKHYVANGHNLI